MSTNEMVRVSTPQEIYNELLRPRDTSGNLAIRGLVVKLGLRHSSTEFTKELGKDISDAMIAHPTAIVRPREESPIAVGEQIVGLMTYYPWLQDVTQPAPPDGLRAEHLANWTANYMFDDYPGLFGISNREAWQFRLHVTAAWPHELAEQLNIEM